MTKNVVVNVPRDALEQAKIVERGWRELEDKLSVPNLSIEEFSEKVAAAQKIATLAERLRQERAEAIKKRDQMLIEIWDLTKRVRNAAKATFGDLSPEIQKFSLTPSKKEKFRK